MARGERPDRAAEILLGGELHHYRSKITMKRSGSGGTWVEHQDYGYSNGCLRPGMLTVTIPLTRTTRRTVASACSPVRIRWVGSITVSSARRVFLNPENDKSIDGFETLAVS